jgi:hypothetical protein
MAEPTYEELKARVAELEKQKLIRSLQFKVGDKGGVSVYGLGRFPRNALLRAMAATTRCGARTPRFP